MNTGITYRSFSVLLALTFFIQTIGFSMDVHYCQGEIQSYSLFGKAEACDMMKSQSRKTKVKSCCKRKMQSSSEDHKTSIHKHCCYNQMIHLELDDDINLNSSVCVLDNSNLTTISSVANAPEIILTPTRYRLVKNTGPPRYKRNIRVLYQVFRI